MYRASYYLAFGSVVSIVVSIALSQVLLGLSLACLLLSGARIEFPPIRAPLAFFFAATVVSLFLSPDPQGGLPQIRKFYVFATLIVVYTTFRSLRQVRHLILAWVGVGTVSALVGLSQFLERRHEAIAEHAPYYEYLLDGRITGFASHWMTFGGEEMILLIMLASLLLFGRRRWWTFPGILAGLVLFSAIALGMTRCIFLLGLPVGMLYLFWKRSWRLTAAVPLLAIIAYAAAPSLVKERIASVAHPHGEMDSNSHRAVCRIVGWEMVKAHPWFGLGPEQVGKQFTSYVPVSVHRPLPNGWYGHLHNIYLQYWAERGIFGLVGILWTIATCLYDFLRHLRNGAPKALLYGATAVILAILAEGMFEYNLGDSEVLTSFLAVIACAYAAIRAATPAVPQWSLRNRLPIAERDSSAPHADAYPVVPE